VEDDPLLAVTNDEVFADRVISDQHWIDEDGMHFVVTAVLRTKPSIDGQTWSIHGYAEGDRRNCSDNGS
jgi:hypothetical protein